MNEEKLNILLRTAAEKAKDLLNIRLKAVIQTKEKTFAVQQKVFFELFGNM